MTLWQNYLRPKTLSEAVDALVNAPGPALPIAGGTDLLLDLKQGRHSPVHTLVDLTFIPEMSALEIRGDSLFIGAAVPVNRIALDPLVGTHAQALVEACNLIAGPQVRNTATLGGNVAHALPAADGTIALTALDAVAEVASTALSGGLSSDERSEERIETRSRSASVETRRVPFTSLFLGPGKSSIDKTKELIVGFHIPIPNSRIPNPDLRHASCFKRIMRPQGVALPILNCAVWLARVDNSIKDIHIAIGPGGATPFRATQAEDTLRGQSLNDTTFESALDALLAQARFRTSARRASADYRKHIVSGLFRDTVETAWLRSAVSDR